MISHSPCEKGCFQYQSLTMYKGSFQWSRKFSMIKEVFNDQGSFQWSVTHRVKKDVFYDQSLTIIYKGSLLWSVTHHVQRKFSMISHSPWQRKFSLISHSSCKFNESVTYQYHVKRKFSMISHSPCTKEERAGRRVSHKQTFLCSLDCPAVAISELEPTNWKSEVVRLWHCRDCERIYHIYLHL